MATSLNPSTTRPTAPLERTDQGETGERAELVAKADRCRRLARGIADPNASAILSDMARDYQDAADRLRR